MTADEIQRAVGPLRLIFWGALLCVLDFSINGFDILNDTIGTLLLALGVWGFSTWPVEEASYRPRLQLLQVVAVIAVFHSISAQLPVESPPAVTLLETLFSIVKLAASVLFCMVMMQVCGEAGLIPATQSWAITRNLFFWIYAVPLGLFHVIAMGAILTDSSFHIDLGPLALLLLPVFLGPLIHFFISTSRMKRDAESAGYSGMMPSAS